MLIAPCGCFGASKVRKVFTSGFCCCVWIFKSRFRGENEGMAEFDEFAADYDAALKRGLALSGESKGFFIEGRLRFLRQCLVGLGVALPEKVLDFGCGTGDT